MMRIRQKLWVTVTLACFFVGASFWLLAPGSSPSKVSAASASGSSSARTTLFVSGRNERLKFADAADLPEDLNAMTSLSRPVALSNADLDSDGYPDLVAAYWTENGGQLRVRFGT